MLVVFATSIVLLDLHGIATYFVVGYTPSFPGGDRQPAAGDPDRQSQRRGCINAVAIWFRLASGRGPDRQLLDGSISPSPSSRLS